MPLSERRHSSSSARPLPMSIAKETRRLASWPAPSSSSADGDAHGFAQAEVIAVVVQAQGARRVLRFFRTRRKFCCTLATINRIRENSGGEKTRIVLGRRRLHVRLRRSGPYDQRCKRHYRRSARQGFRSRRLSCVVATAVTVNISVLQQGGRLEFCI
jgi:hypothetical protein